MLTGIIIPAVIALVLLVAITVVFASLYTRSSRDTAFVRTGLGGKKVVLDGGALVLPIFQSIAWVQLKTLRLLVRRGEEEALITSDRMRVDISAEFYVRVKTDIDSIALAAQTLGDRTNDAEELRVLIEAKFVDSLRSVAATMTLTDLQEKRIEFVKAVQETVAHDLESNGLELESVSLTRLDQTDIRHFNPNNTFDAEGLTTLTRLTEARRKERNDITRETEVSIAAKDLEAAQKTLLIDQQKADATLNQQRDIAQKTAATRAETAQKEAQARQAEEEARIGAEQAIAEREASARQARESAQILSEREVKRTQETASRDIEIVKQENAIAVANKSREESEAKAEAETARALATTAEEKVTTAKSVEIAERARRIEVIAAEKDAMVEATGITVQAQAEKEAAENQAYAIRTLAQARAESEKIEATGIVEKGRALADAEMLMNEARNKLSEAVIEYEISRERIRMIPLALAETVKPLENISDIRIFDTGGMMGNRGGTGTMAGTGGFGDNLSAQLLSYRANSAVMDKLLSEAGMTGSDPVQALLNGLTGGQAERAEADPAAVPAKAAIAAKADSEPRIGVKGLKGKGLDGKGLDGKGFDYKAGSAKSTD